MNMLLLGVLGLFFSGMLVEEDPNKRLLREIEGAWKMVDESASTWEDNSGWQQVKLISGGYFMLASYDTRKRAFQASAGGTYAIRNGKYTEYVIFHTVDPSLIGKSFTFQVQLTDGKLLQRGNVRVQGLNMHLDEEYRRVDYGTESPVAGAWRLQNGQIAAYGSGSQRTLMLTTGTRFQRVTFDGRTKQVYSSVGGGYSFRSNRWSESHAFNSRSLSSIGQRYSYPARYEGQRLGIKQREGYEPDTYIRLN